MSVYLYDKALIDKLKEITGDERIRIVPPELALSFLAKANKDNIQLPAIVVQRSNVSLNDIKNQYAYLKGQTVKITKDNTAVKMKLIPMRIQWSINVYTVDRLSCDEIIRELIFYFMTYPRFQVQVPYGLDYPQNFDVFIESEIEDNSDLVNFPNTGEYFRETITVYTENAHMFSSGQQYLTKVTSDVKDSDDHI